MKNLLDVFTEFWERTCDSTLRKLDEGNPIPALVFLLVVIGGWLIGAYVSTRWVLRIILGV